MQPAGGLVHQQRGADLDDDAGRIPETGWGRSAARAMRHGAGSVGVRQAGAASACAPRPTAIGPLRTTVRMAARFDIFSTNSSMRPQVLVSSTV